MKAIDLTLGRFGAHGLPLMLNGDWNDGLNLVGHRSRGESTWLGFFLYDILTRFSRIIDLMDGHAAKDQYAERAERLKESLNKLLRDGRYPRATTDDGGLMFFSDALSAAWPVISGVADFKQGALNLDLMLKDLEEDHLVRLLYPPFAEGVGINPGKLADYPPGVRENGAQYSHGASWLVDALVRLSEMAAAAGDDKPDYICASIGLPLPGLTRTRVGLNLLPQEMRRKVRQIAKPLFSLLVVLALLLAGTWGVGIYRYYRNDLDRLRAEVKKRKPEVEAVEKLQKRRGELVREITELEKIRSGEARKIDILKEFTQVLPPTVWIWNLKCSGRDVEISGFADSASELIPILDKSPLFERVEFSSPVTKERERKGTTERKRERFKIKMKLESRRAGP